MCTGHTAIKICCVISFITTAADGDTGNQLQAITGKLTLSEETYYDVNQCRPFSWKKNGLRNDHNVKISNRVSTRLFDEL